jgi:hypothetical protein
LKRVHRLIVRSATYRQSSKVSPALEQRDPYNRGRASIARSAAASRRGRRLDQLQRLSRHHGDLRYRPGLMAAPTCALQQSRNAFGLPIWRTWSTGA